MNFAVRNNKELATFKSKYDFRPEQGGTPVLPETSDMFSDSYFLRAEIKKNKVGFYMLEL